MFIFQSTVGIAKVHGMRPVFARNQLSLLNTIFDIFEYTAVRFEIGLVDGELEPDYQARDAENGSQERPTSIRSRTRRSEDIYRT